MTLNHPIIVALASAAVIAGLSACGSANHDSANPTITDIQQQALVDQTDAEQDPAKRYPPLPPSPGKPFVQDVPKLSGNHGSAADLRIAPPEPINQLQQDQDPVVAALQRIQEIAAQTADISNRPEEARNQFKAVEPLYDAVKHDLDGKTRDALEKGFKDMRAALDHSAAAIPGGSQPEQADALAEAEDASGDIQVVIYRFVQENFKPNTGDIIDERDEYCSPISGCGPHPYGETN